MTLRTEEAAAALMRDHAAKKKIVPFARDYGATDLAGAYAIQAAYVKRLEGKLGRRVGYKIGLTSKRMQEMCGVDHPNSGVVFEQRVLKSGATLSLSNLGRLGIEFECCARLGKPLAPRGRPYTLDDVAAAVDAVCPAFEVIDDRNSDYPLDLLSLVADNSWNEGNVLGEFTSSWPELDKTKSVLECDGLRIDLLRCEVHRDGALVRLTRTEWRLLQALAMQPGRTMTHQQLFDAVWAKTFGNPQQYLRVHVTNLRRKIERTPAMPVLVVTEPGVGYRFEGDPG